MILNWVRFFSPSRALRAHTVQCVRAGARSGVVRQSLGASTILLFIAATPLVTPPPPFLFNRPSCVQSFIGLFKAARLNPVPQRRQRLFSPPEQLATRGCTRPKSGLITPSLFHGPFPPHTGPALKIPYVVRVRQTQIDPPCPSRLLLVILFPPFLSLQLFKPLSLRHAGRPAQFILPSTQPSRSSSINQHFEQSPSYENTSSPRCWSLSETRSRLLLACHLRS